MSTLALESQGATFEYYDSTLSPPAFVTIAEVKAINGPSGNANVIDVSDLQSLMKEKRIGLADYGNVSLDLFYIPQNPSLSNLRAEYKARTRAQYRITFTDSPATTWTFYGYVSHLSVNFAVDAPVNGTITVEIDGDVTEAP